MKKQGVIISADIVTSTQQRKKLQAHLKDWLKTIQQETYIQQIEIFRGDGIQTYVPNPEDGLKALLFQYLFFKQHQVDVRQALGVGNIELIDKQLATSIGEAFILSGRALDGLKSAEQLIRIVFENDQLNPEWEVHSYMLTNLFQEITPSQAEAILLMLQNKSQSEAAKTIEISQAAVQQRLKAAKYQLLQVFLKRYEEMLSHA